MDSLFMSVTEPHAALKGYFWPLPHSQRAPTMFDLAEFEGICASSQNPGRDLSLER